MQTLTILGSTGSVGQSTLDVVSLHPDDFSVIGLSANTNVEKMLTQCLKFKPKVVAMCDHAAAAKLELALKAHNLNDIAVEAGEQAVCALAADINSDTVMSAIVGAAGLLPTLEAVKVGKRVLIANKEPLVMTGGLFMQESKASGATILPIDSEHNAVFQCLPSDQSKADVKKVHLTASGGPFRGQTWADLVGITPEQACAHPNWSMGQKISVDSATMMNKGLELIEASALFDLPPHQIDIVVHPQSIIHSMVEYHDGSFLAQLGSPDMRIPIAHALAWPARIESGAATLNIIDIARLDFHAPDMPNLPCLRLAREAAEAGGAAPIALNAANEIAVDAFLKSRITFTNIADVIQVTLNEAPPADFNSIEDVLQIDNEARRISIAALDSIA